MLLFRLKNVLIIFNKPTGRQILQLNIIENENVGKDIQYILLAFVLNLLCRGKNYRIHINSIHK